MQVPLESRRALLPLKTRIIENFIKGNWLELGILTDCSDLIDGHIRLLRSLDFGDDDYEGNTLEVLSGIIRRDDRNLSIIQNYVDGKFQPNGICISSKETEQPRIYFTPNVFRIPEEMPDPTLLTVMMPFSGQFRPVYEEIKKASHRHGLKCQRADDIWDHSTIIQDVFSLLYRSFIVVCDFSDKNPNVFYEAGIAHTLGKHVIPLTQHASDVPFDLQSHRYIHYLNNAEGIATMGNRLGDRISTLLKDQRRNSWAFSR